MINICLDDIRAELTKFIDGIIQDMPDRSVLDGNNQAELDAEIQEWRDKIKNRLAQMDSEAADLLALILPHLQSQVGLDIKIPNGGNANMLGIYKYNGR